ncbi:MAG: glycosyltransferase family 4 protein, partial [Bacteroidales bacterium]|nr:glycosyltransferase family 4 protein [Bacteroidales bacterium]
MKVLMFGWEFPPHISGGLGTACFGLTKALSKMGIEIQFIVPKMFGDEDRSFMQIQGAGDVIIKQNTHFSRYKEFWEKFTYIEVGSTLIPYLYPEDYEKLINSQTLKFGTEDIQREIFKEDFLFSGTYGKDLYKEVARYAFVAGLIASKRDFDIIHAHDWLTYPAGIAAKEVSGKQLIVHVHATEYDRSGENINQTVYDIEKQGMDIADKVITVSHLTRNTVIEKYHINPDKVFTVHNSVEPINLPYDFQLKSAFKEKIVTFLGRVTFQKG